MITPGTGEVIALGSKDQAVPLTDPHVVPGGVSAAPELPLFADFLPCFPDLLSNEPLNHEQCR